MFPCNQLQFTVAVLGQKDTGRNPSSQIERDQRINSGKHTPWKFNMNTKKGNFFQGSHLFQGPSFWVSILIFGGGKIREDSEILSDSKFTSPRGMFEIILAMLIQVGITNLPARVSSLNLVSTGSSLFIKENLKFQKSLHVLKLLYSNFTFSHYNEVATVRYQYVDGRNPKQPPGMYKTLGILGYRPYQLVCRISSINSSFNHVSTMVSSSLCCACVDTTSHLQTNQFTVIVIVTSILFPGGHFVGGPICESKKSSWDE